MASAKKERHDDVSDIHKCQKCGKPIKTRLVRIKQTPPKLCYQHWLEANGKTSRKHPKYVVTHIKPHTYDD